MVSTFLSAYRRLSEVCEARGINLSSYRAMDAQMKNVLLADTIGAERLLAELHSLERAGYESLYTTREERKLAARTRRLYLIGKFLDFSLSPEEWEEYMESLRAEDLPVSSFESFDYRALERGETTAEKLLSR